MLWKPACWRRRNSASQNEAKDFIGDSPLLDDGQNDSPMPIETGTTYACSYSAARVHEYRTATDAYWHCLPLTANDVGTELVVLFQLPLKPIPL